MSLDEIVPPASVAIMLGGVPLGTLRYWRAVGEGPPSFKLGRRVVYRRQAVERWVAQQEASEANRLQRSRSTTPGQPHSLT